MGEHRIGGGTSGKEWERRDVRLYDEQTKSGVLVKLGGKHADLVQNLSSGKLVTIKNCVVDVFNNTTSLNSTSETALEVSKIIKAIF